MQHNISRRKALVAGSVAGVVGSVGGCLGDSDDTDETVQIDTSIPDEPVSITIPYPLATEATDTLSAVLRRAGLPEPIEVDVVEYAQSSAAFLAAYRRLLFDKESEPALLMADSGWLTVLAAEHSLVNLSRALPEDLIEYVDTTYLEMARQTATIDGAYYGIPLWIDVGTMLYRQDLIEEAGYDPQDRGWATDPPSWRPFSEIAKQTAEQADVPVPVTAALDNYPGLACCTFNEFMSSFGGAYFGSLENLFGPVGDRPVTVTEQPVIEALELLQTFVEGVSGPAETPYASDIVPRAARSWTFSQAEQQFLDGNAVLHRGWPFEILSASQQSFGDSLGVMPIPGGVSAADARYEGTGGPVSALGGWHLCLNPHAPPQKLQAAYHVIDTMTTERFNLELLDAAGLLPPNVDLLTASRIPDSSVLEQYADALQAASENTIARPVTTVWSEQSQVIADHVNSVFSRFRDPRAAMTDLDEQLRAIESNPQ